MGKYYVGYNTCNCHPETCGCNDWAVYDPNNEKYTTCFRKDVAEELAEMCNRRQDEHKDI